MIHPTRCEVTLGPSVEVDLHEQLKVAEGHLCGERSLEVARKDLETLRGALLPDWEDEWLTPERERARQLRLHALEALAERLSDAERFADAAEVGLAATQEDPLRESAQRVLIGVYLAEGNLNDANRQAEQFRRLVAARLGLRPSPRFSELLARMEPVTKA